jgi:hypothetical protein
VFDIVSLRIASKQGMHPAFLASCTNTSTKKQLFALIQQMYLHNNFFWGLCLLQYTCKRYGRAFDMCSLSIASKPDLHPAFLASCTNTGTKKQLYALIQQLYFKNKFFWGLSLLQYTYKTYGRVFDIVSLRIASKQGMHPAFLASCTNTSTRKQLFALIQQMYLNNNFFWGLLLLQYTH